MIYVNTFSHSLAPSMRMGYMVLPERLMELRGFCGEFPSAAHGRGSAASWPYALVCPVLMLLARYFDLSALLGGLFV